MTKPMKWSLLCILFLSGVWVFSSILAPFILGFVLAYGAQPLMTRLKQYGVSPFWGALILTMLIYVLLAVLIITLIPFLKELSFLCSQRILAYRETFWGQMLPVMQKFSKDFGKKLQESFDVLVMQGAKWGAEATLHMLQNTWGLARFVFVLILGPIISFYLLRDWDVMKQRCTALVPLHHQGSFLKGLGEIDGALSRYLRGQMGVSLVLAMYYAVALGISSLHFGVTLGILTGLFSFIPYLVFFGSLTLSCLLFFFQGMSMPHLMSICLIYAGGQILEVLVLTPWLIGNKTGLHPLWVLFAIFAGGSLAGFSGILMALPVATILAACWRLGRNKMLHSSLFS
jgi:predicted PurR-regulated permease PerM